MARSGVTHRELVGILCTIGSCICFRRDHAVVLRALKWKQIGAKELKVIEMAIQASIRAMFSR